MKKVSALVIALALLTGPGCAAVVSNLPVVIAAVTDAQMIINSIQTFVDAYFARHPDLDADTKAKIDHAIGVTQSSLQAALRIAQGAEKLDQAEIDAAFADFKAAYSTLLALIAPLGVSAADTANGGQVLAVLRTSEGLIVPTPLAMTLRVKK